MYMYLDEINYCKLKNRIKIMNLFYYIIGIVFLILAKHQIKLVATKAQNLFPMIK